MKNILVRSFPSLDNYGTGMMGLVALDRLRRVAGEHVQFHCDFVETTDISEILSEMETDSSEAELHAVDVVRKVTRPVKNRNSFVGTMRRMLRQVAGPSLSKDMDLVVVLGGDELSEVYSKGAWQYIATAWRWSRSVPVVFLGHTIGPFSLRRNRLAARYLLPSIHIFPRDRWCTGYLAEEFGLGERLIQSTDLAYADLPLQHRIDIRDAVLDQYGLAPDGYATMIVSGLGAKYYATDQDLFLERHAEMATRILARPDMAGRRLCMLAHTHGRMYGDEASSIRAVIERLPAEVRDRIVAVTDRVLQTRARFILGHGLFTVTGRMHPAVSTFQMGKPAIALSYSKKYEGVIGTMLGRSDLIIEAKDSRLWESGEIVDRALDRVDYVMAEHVRLATEIRAAIAAQKQTVDATFEHITRLLHVKGAR